MTDTELVETDPLGTLDVAAVVAAAGPLAPPGEWFENPGLEKATPLTVTADGRVYGHIAAWGVRHIGMPGHVTPPKSRSNYAYFKTGVVATAGGQDVEVGQITLSGGHASVRADAGEAVAHYDDTASAIADVNVGEDKHGIWVAGSIRPNATETQIRALRASAPSGDWRPINGNLELVACCQVNVPGFPIARAMVASGGEVLALVAAGASDMAMRRYREADADLEARVASIEAAVTVLATNASREELRRRVRS